MVYSVYFYSVCSTIACVGLMIFAILLGICYVRIKNLFGFSALRLIVCLLKIQKRMYLNFFWRYCNTDTVFFIYNTFAIIYKKKFPNRFTLEIFKLFFVCLVFCSLGGQKNIFFDDRKVKKRGFSGDKFFYILYINPLSSMKTPFERAFTN